MPAWSASAPVRLPAVGDVLEARGLRKRFKAVEAVSGIDILIPPGTRVGLLGTERRR